MKLPQEILHNNGDTEVSMVHCCSIEAVARWRLEWSGVKWGWGGVCLCFFPLWGGSAVNALRRKEEVWCCVRASGQEMAEATEDESLGNVMVFAPPTPLQHFYLIMSG